MGDTEWLEGAGGTLHTDGLRRASAGRSGPSPHTQGCISKEGPPCATPRPEGLSHGAVKANARIVCRLGPAGEGRGRHISPK